MPEYPEYLNKLNPRQLEAATSIEGPLLILAGAGSGKTGTMTHRIAYMIRAVGISPYSILAVTFTNKAAKEMLERVEALIGPVPGIWIQTFHSASLRMLRSYADRLGYGKNFVVYDPTDQSALVKRIVKDLRLDEKRNAPKYVLSEISHAKEREIDPELYARKYGDSYSYKDVAKIYEAYEDALKKNNAMDFDDLIGNAVRLLAGCPDVLDRYRRQFSYVMVDEYQDTNMLQYKLVRLLTEESRNLCVVGDGDQCIYQWRGADIRNILEFEKDFPGARVIKLEQNYRSSGNIIEAAHSVIKNNKGRKDKKMWTSAESGEKVEYYRAEDDREEARYICARIDALMRKDAGLRYSDFAILYRTNAQSRGFEDMLTAKSIPYQILSGLKFWDRKEIKDMMCYMRLVANPKDDISMLRIINEPRRGMGPKTVDGIRAMAAAMGISMLEAMQTHELQESLSPKLLEAVLSLTGMLGELSENADRLSVGDIYDALLVKSGYLKALEDQESVEADGRIENLMEFKSVIAEKEQEAQASGGILTLESFMEGLSIQSDIDEHDPDQDAVVLMTLHSAKGLEFPVVFMPGLEMGLFPSYRTIDKGDDLEEERRLCYVGMTRAKQRLYLTSAEQRMLYGKTDRQAESPFLKEIDRKFMTGTAVYDKRGEGISFSRYDSGARNYSSGPYISPIAAAAAARTNSRSVSAQINKPRETLENTALTPGDKVSHERFGEGTVIEISGKTIVVIFDSVGTKKLAIDKAPMKKL